jgi:hypothetical protein
MKLRSREINIFSMSALDLFASAMGAFMFLAIIALPFFPNTGDSPERVAKVKKELEVVKSQLEQEKKEKEEIKKELTEEKSTAKISFPPMDMIIALDTTASMDKQVEGLRTEIVQIADLLMKLSPDVAMGIIDFKDRCEPGGAIRRQPLVKLTGGSLKQLQRFANTMTARSHNCNQDYEEAIDQAMDTALNMGWRSTSKAKTIIVISDNSAYASKTNSTLTQARDFNRSGKKNQVSTVFVPTIPNAYGKDFLRRLAKQGGGKFVTGGGSFTATILLALAD